MKKRVPTIFIFGKTKAGKSHLGNLLLDGNYFEEGHELDSQTSYPKLVQGRLAKSEIEVRVVDTIGFSDNRTDTQY